MLSGCLTNHVTNMASLSPVKNNPASQIAGIYQ